MPSSRITAMASGPTGLGLVPALEPHIDLRIRGEANLPPSGFAPSFLCALQLGANPRQTLIVGLAVFAVVFAINSAVHSYLVLATQTKTASR